MSKYVIKRRPAPLGDEVVSEPMTRAQARVELDFMRESRSDGSLFYIEAWRPLSRPEFPAPERL